MILEKINRSYVNPHSFSFKDLLALVYSVSLLVMEWLNFWSIGNVEVTKTLIPLNEIVLSGYFIHEIGQMGYTTYIQYKQGKVQNTKTQGDDLNSKI